MDLNLSKIAEHADYVFDRASSTEKQDICQIFSKMNYKGFTEEEANWVDAVSQIMGSVLSRFIK